MLIENKNRSNPSYTDNKVGRVKIDPTHMHRKERGIDNTPVVTPGTGFTVVNCTRTHSKERGKDNTPVVTPRTGLTVVNCTLTARREEKITHR